MTLRRLGLSALCLSLTLGGTTAIATPPTARLPLGPANLTETRDTRTLQPGVTLTTIVRGQADPSAGWTVEIAIPSSSPDPDAPAAALSDQAGADKAAAELRAAGLDPRVEDVPTPPLADAGENSLGYRVRVGLFGTKAEADALRTKVIAAGLNGSSLYTGWDGEPDDIAGSTGPWHVQVLTIDPKTFRGKLDATYGPDIEKRETTSALATLTGATAAVNAGFFVLDPKSGAPGDPAGVGVYDGRLLSEPTNGRPALVLGPSGTSVDRFTWRGSVGKLPLDGLNRYPGLIRNCGGTADDLPTSKPMHDTTCTDPDELIAFDPSYGASTPTGPGAEVVLDRRGIVTEIRSARGGAIPAGGRTVQATGNLVAPLLATAHVGKPLAVRSTLLDERGRPVPLTRRTTIVNGGPELVRDGRIHVTAAADGMVQSTPSFYYGWVHKRNPRTIAGVDDHGRTVLITADGRNVNSLGLSIAEAAVVAKSFHLTQAINLDGGGSTTMVANGTVLNTPSDATGERPVGDALVITK
ncbi:phosphodiester glycosidase family protein [Kribbella sp. NPDC059898]|uniref:phosphodiester glycosidase family protein n=1 Tax=Kribbella sp. NPDC059898 TaxID=3346995 RepID=UPI00364CFDB3